MLHQVLNMKPPEILGMLEEAAGTRMYESKKEAALRTLDKKQVKVEEINKVLAGHPRTSSMLMTWTSLYVQQACARSTMLMQYRHNIHYLSQGPV